MTDTINKIKKQIINSLSKAQLENVDARGEAVIQVEADKILITLEKAIQEARLDERRNSQQRKWQNKNVEAGLCRVCGMVANSSWRGLCEKHKKYSQERKKRYYRKKYIPKKFHCNECIDKVPHDHKRPDDTLSLKENKKLEKKG